MEADDEYETCSLARHEERCQPIMPPPRDPNDGYTLEEAVIAQSYEHEALLKLLIEKGVITKDEYLEKAKHEIHIARVEGRERFRKG